MLRLVHNTQSPETDSTTTTRETIMKCVGISEDGELIMLDEFHWNGVSLDRFVGVTQEQIDERNDIENIKENYSYLWQEAVAEGTTEESLEEYLEGLLETELDYGGAYFWGHDDSYTSYITDKDKERYDEQSGDVYETVCFECIGGGTPSELPKLKEIWDAELWNRALEHHETIRHKNTQTELKVVK